jgi:hypothetical protein
MGSRLSYERVLENLADDSLLFCASLKSSFMEPIPPARDAL